MAGQFYDSPSDPTDMNAAYQELSAQMADKMNPKKKEPSFLGSLGTSFLSGLGSGIGSGLIGAGMRSLSGNRGYGPEGSSDMDSVGQLLARQFLEGRLSDILSKSSKEGQSAFG